VWLLVGAEPEDRRRSADGDRQGCGRRAGAGAEGRRYQLYDPGWPAADDYEDHAGAPGAGLGVCEIPDGGSEQPPVYQGAWLPAGDQEPPVRPILRRTVTQAVRGYAAERGLPAAAGQLRRRRQRGAGRLPADGRRGQELA